MLYKSTHNCVLLLAEKVIRIAVKSIVNTWCKNSVIGARKLPGLLITRTGPVNKQSTIYWAEAQIPF